MARTRLTARKRRAVGVAEVLRLCAHPYRLIILCLLEHEPWSVGDLAAETRLSQPAVSQHLARLRKANIVAATRNANTIYYRLNGNQYLPELSAVVSVFCRKLAEKDRHTP
jgi:DNA-binding transcriptional ArsR family regulator